MEECFCLKFSGIKEPKENVSHLISPAAFVEGGIQNACDDACSICLEEFCDSDPSTLTTCMHEFHLQCILEWCQRSSQCPMCWRQVSLKDPGSQELLEAVVEERNFRVTSARNTAIFHHPTLGDFELQHLANDADLEERIIQHLAAAAAMRRTRHAGRREGQRNRSSPHGHPNFMIFSDDHGAHPTGPVSVSGGNTELVPIAVASSTLLQSGLDEPSQQIYQFPSVQNNQNSSSASVSNFMQTNRHRTSSLNQSSAGTSPTPNEERAGPSDFQSFPESLKSKFSAMSMRYKETFSKSTRGWKERLFSRSTSMSDVGSEVRREVNAGIASVSRMMERLDTRENDRPEVRAHTGKNSVNVSVIDRSNQDNAESCGKNSLEKVNHPATHAASSSRN